MISIQSERIYIRESDSAARKWKRDALIFITMCYPFYITAHKVTPAVYHSEKRNKITLVNRSIIPHRSYTIITQVERAE